MAIQLHGSADVEPLQPRHWALAHLRTCASPALQAHVARHGCSPELFNRLANATEADYLHGFTVERLSSEGLLPPAAAGEVVEASDVLPDEAQPSDTNENAEAAVATAAATATATDHGAGGIGPDEHLDAAPTDGFLTAAAPVPSPEPVDTSLSAFTHGGGF